jgi:hypothetical protein
MVFCHLFFSVDGNADGNSDSSTARGMKALRIREDIHMNAVLRMLWCGSDSQ